MSQPIDVLIIDPVHLDASRTVQAIHRKAPKASTVRVSGADQAERLMFEHGLFSEAPQVPGLIIMDLNAIGDSAKTMLRRLRNDPATCEIPVVIFSANRDEKDILHCHLCGVQMNLLKPTDANEYTVCVERIMAMWLARAFIVTPIEKLAPRTVQNRRPVRTGDRTPVASLQPGLLEV